MLVVSYVTFNNVCLGKNIQDDPHNWDEHNRKGQGPMKVLFVIHWITLCFSCSVMWNIKSDINVEHMSQFALTHLP